MKRILASTLMALALVAKADTVTLELQNNTPLFEGEECHVYTGQEALRAVYQLVASTRLRLEVISSVVEEPAFIKLLEEKAAFGKYVNVYSNTTLPEIQGIKSHQLGEAQPSSLIITSDSSYIGIGNIRLSKAVKRYSSFVVCRAGETYYKMKDSVKKYTKVTQR